MKKRLLALILALGLAVTGCGGGGEDSEAEPEETNEESQENTDEAEEPKEDDEAGDTADGEMDEDQYYNTYYNEEPTTLSSAQGTDTSSQKILNNVMEPLVRIIENVDDETLDIEPAGAESWEVSDDNLTYTFKIRDNKWSDGEAVTAKDYEFGIKTALDVEKGAGGMGYLIDCIEGAKESMAGDISSDEIGVKALDDQTLEIKLERPTPHFLQLCSLRPTFPIRQDVFEEQGESYGNEADAVVYNGPFVVKSWTHQTELQLEKNPEYWDIDNVHFETVNWRILPEETTRMNAFLNGELDNIEAQNAEWVAEFEQLDDVSKDDVKIPALRFMFFNTEEKPFTNPKVRLALSLAIDREEALEAIYNGVGVPAYGWVMHGVTYEGTEYRSQVGEPLKDMMDSYDPKELLAEGLEEEGLDPENFEFTFDMGGTDQQSREMGDYFENNFREKLGITTNIVLNEWSAFSDKINNGDYQVGIMTWTADYNDAYHMLNLMMSGVEGIPTHWSNEEYDQLVMDGLVSDDPDERLEKYEEAEKMVAEQAPVIPIVYVNRGLFRKDYVKNYQNSEFSTQGLKYMYTSGR